MSGDPLPSVLEQAAREAITFQLVDGRVRYDGRPTPGLLAGLREHRDKISRTLERGQCCWCRRRSGYYHDHDTRLPMCRPCALEIGQARLDSDADLGAHCSDERPTYDDDVAVGEVVGE